MSQNTISPSGASATAGGHTHLPASWQDWITTNVLRGCERADMQRIMVENGFDPVFARHAIEIIGGIGERVQDLPEDERADSATRPRPSASSRSCRASRWLTARWNWRP